MTAFVSGLGFIVLSLCQPYRPGGWPVVMGRTAGIMIKDGWRDR